MLALDDWARTICGCGCGQPVSESHKPIAYDVKSFVCYAGRAIQQQSRNEAEDALAQKKSPGWDDGLHYYVTPILPDDQPES